MGLAANPVITGESHGAVGRTLSKSDFVLARSCEAKLYFRESGYPDSRNNDPYLGMLAEGGYMVEALAKARYPGGVQLSNGGPVADAFRATVEALQAPSVTVFEATLLAGRRQARADIIERRGAEVRLVEVKAKSFDGAEHAESLASGGNGVFRTRRGISEKWRAKLEDLTFQLLLLEKALPGVRIHPFLALVDKSKRASLDGVPRLFDLVRAGAGTPTDRLVTARYNGTLEELPLIDVVTEVDVSEEVAFLRDEVEEAASRLEAMLDSDLETYLQSVERGAHCAKCEFHAEEELMPNGFFDCWGPLARQKPHVLDLYNAGSAKAPDRSPLVTWMYNNSRAGLLDVPTEGLMRKDGTVGPVATRQLRQIEHTRSGNVYVGQGLRGEIERLAWPVHLIDFETSRLALPYHSGMRPYGLVAFQWSCHSVATPGASPRHSEWLNDVDIWPNQTFAESLRSAIGDHGSVLTWSHFEGSVLREIWENLAEFGRDCPELVAWMKDLVDNRLIDMHEWAQYHFYHPGMRGSTSIKVVLESIWQNDDRVRADLASYTGLSTASINDPYQALPSQVIGGEPRVVREGTGAMIAYKEMMYGATSSDRAARSAWNRLLRSYCELDTLSMVLILNYWTRISSGA